LMGRGRLGEEKYRKDGRINLVLNDKREAF
jgi:hypothetical protein